MIVKTTDEKNKKLNLVSQIPTFIRWSLHLISISLQDKNDWLIQFNTKFGDKSMTIFNFTRKYLWNKHAVTEENASTNESTENLLAMIIKTTDEKNKTVKSCNSNSYFYSLIFVLNLNLITG